MRRCHHAGRGDGEQGLPDGTETFDENEASEILAAMMKGQTNPNKVARPTSKSHNQDGPESQEEPKRVRSISEYHDFLLSSRIDRAELLNSLPKVGRRCHKMPQNATKCHKIKSTAADLSSCRNHMTELHGMQRSALVAKRTVSMGSMASVSKFLLWPASCCSWWY